MLLFLSDSVHPLDLYTAGWFLCETEPTGPSAALIHINTSFGKDGVCEDITVEAETISTKLAGALVAKPLGRESFIHSSKFY